MCTYALCVKIMCRCRCFNHVHVRPLCSNLVCRSDRKEAGARFQTGGDNRKAFVNWCASSSVCSARVRVGVMWISSCGFLAVQCGSLKAIVE